MSTNYDGSINRMPAEIKAKWLAALRSGQYKQGKLFLYDGEEDAYCCLGVLEHCITGEVETWELYGKLISSGLPSMEWLHQQFIFFNSNDPHFFYNNDVITSASTLNDELGLDFYQIANIIDEQVEGI